jgi:hypothetical protein
MEETPTLDDEVTNVQATKGTTLSMAISQTPEAPQGTMAALIISPTHELAMQTQSEVLKQGEEPTAAFKYLLGNRPRATCLQPRAPGAFYYGPDIGKGIFSYNR